MNRKMRNLLIFIAVLGILNSCNNSQKKEVGNSSKEFELLKTELEKYKKEKEQEEFNKKLIVDFFQEVFGELKFDAMHKYIGDKYIQHSPDLADGKEALLAAAKVWYKNAKPKKIDIRRVFAEDDLVFIHTKAPIGKNGLSFMHVFRFENGMIVEHWETKQEVPEHSANDNTMF